MYTGLEPLTQSKDISHCWISSPACYRLAYCCWLDREIWNVHIMFDCLHTEPSGIDSWQMYWSRFWAVLANWIGTGEMHIQCLIFMWSVLLINSLKFVMRPFAIAMNVVIVSSMYVQVSVCCHSVVNVCAGVSLVTEHRASDSRRILVWWAI